MKWSIYAIKKFYHLTETLGRSNSLITLFKPAPRCVTELYPLSPYIRLYLCYWQIMSSKQCFSLLQFELTLTPLQIIPHVDCIIFGIHTT